MTTTTSRNGFKPWRYESTAFTRSGCLVAVPTIFMAGTTTCLLRIVSVAPCNLRNTDDLRDIEYEIEARIEDHSEDVQFSNLSQISGTPDSG